jgi:hypothetical protein
VVEQQTKAMRELSRRAFLEPVAVPADTARAQRCCQAAAAEAAALCRARARACCPEGAGRGRCDRRGCGGVTSGAYGLSRAER